MEEQSHDLWGGGESVVSALQAVYCVMLCPRPAAPLESPRLAQPGTEAQSFARIRGPIGPLRLRTHKERSNALPRKELRCRASDICISGTGMNIHEHHETRQTSLQWRASAELSDSRRARAPCSKGVRRIGVGRITNSPPLYSY